MRIAGNHEQIEVERGNLSVTDPYRLPKQEYFNISIKDDKKTLYRIIFSTKDEAIRFKSLRGKTIQLIKLPIISENGKTIDEAFFHTIKTMEKYTKSMGKSDLEEIKKKAEAVESRQTMTLESLAKIDMGELGEFEDEDLEQQIKEFEDEFEEKATRCATIAKGLLMNIADYYLGSEFIEKNDYIKFKMQLEENSLSTLIFQIDVSKKAIHDISKKIYIGSSTTKDIEALATIQRIVLDVNKYQSILIKEITDDFKRVKERQKEIKSEEKFDEIDDGTIISTSSRKELMKELRKMKQDIDDGEFDEVEEDNNK